MAHYMNGDFESAMRDLKHCVSLLSETNSDHDVPFHYCRMADIAFDWGKPEEAHAYCQQALRIDNSHYGQLRYLYFLYEKPKDFQRVLSTSGELIEDLVKEKALDLQDQEEIDDIECSLEEAFALQASCHVALNRGEDARVAFEKYILVGNWGALRLVMPLLETFIAEKRCLDKVQRCLHGMEKRFEVLKRDPNRRESAKSSDEEFSDYLRRLLAASMAGNGDIPRESYAGSHIRLPEGWWGPAPPETRFDTT